LASPARRLLVLVSFQILFLELACIRWVAAYLPFVGFFGRHVLIAAVLGVALGCLAGEGRAARRLAAAVPALLGALAACLAAGYVALSRGMFQVVLDAPAESGELFFGILPPERSYAGPRIPVEVVLGVVFALLLALFAGLGQRLAAAFGAGAARLGDYALHLAGGLAGALAFSALSALGTPPWVWLSVAAPLAWAGLPRPRSRWHALPLLIALALAWRLATPGDPWMRRFSPYYRVDFDPASLALSVDGLGHQRFLAPAELARAEREDAVYTLLHALRASAGRAPLARELVIGAGGGNDVAAALAAGARRVDAVEIDPVIAELGRAHHPARPYDDPRAHLFVADGRTFLQRRAEPGGYDAVVYALVDSLAACGGYGSVRLENYLFTREALREVRAALAPDGVFALYNFLREPWLVRRLAALVRAEFGQEPIVLSLSSDLDEARGRGLTVILAGDVDDLRAPAAELAAAGGARLLAPDPTYSPASASYGGPLPSDDWPFLYLRERAVPAHNVRMALVVLGTSLLALCALVPRGARGLRAPYFGLGVGFMVLQTTGVARLALLFGATWVASAVTVATLFASGLASTLLVARRPPTRRGAWLAALLAGVALSALLPLAPFASDALAPRLAAVGLTLVAPAFCAGVLFADAFRRTAEPARALGSNLAGLVLGAVLEPLSGAVGLRAVLGVAALAYALAGASLLRKPAG
jgi:SAM-dependent methyltransferase